MSVSPKAAPPAKVFSCPSCGGSIGVHALGMSVTASCKHCGSVVDIGDENLTLIQTAKKKMRVEPLIELGSKGKLFGEIFQLIGFMQRSDGPYAWREYLLFNPTKGFRWLVEFDGHWTYVTTVKHHPDPLGDGAVEYMKERFELFHKGKAVVDFVLGEFYWQVRIGEQTKVQDYINPPQVLSAEISKTETVWSHGTYVEAKTLADNFHLTGPLPIPIGVAPSQPSALRSSVQDVKLTTVILVLLLFIVQFLTVTCSSNRRVFEEELVFRSDDVNKTKVIGPFELDGHLSAVSVRVAGPVYNNWLGTDLELVNEGTGETFAWEQGIEYYAGSDYDGAWSEGSQSSEKILSEVPGGRYRLVVETTGSTGTAGQTYRVALIRGVPIWSNFFVGLFALLIVPVYFWWRHRSFEARRWSTSDFSPYWSMDSESTTEFIGNLLDD